MTSPPKWRSLGFLAAAQTLAMALWFSASAVVPQLTLEWQLDDGQRSWLTMSVQIGFVVGALFSAVLNLADRVRPTRFIALSAGIGALANAAIPYLDLGLPGALAMRFVTGAALAGVYPPGMKLVASWCKEDRGLGIGILVGAINIGSALPYLLNAIPLLGNDGMPPWRSVLTAASLSAILGGIIAVTTVRMGPHLRATAPFDWRFVGRALSHRPTRLANFGYLGHMWELYSMWSWVPLLLLASYAAAGRSAVSARLASFGVIAIGALGSVVAGIFADRIGRVRVTTVCLVVSGACCLVAGLLFSQPVLLTILCLIWGVAVVADSAQFSTAVTELTDPRYVGTALTIQTSLGFLLTVLTIRIIPPLVERFGWDWAFAVLALGPVFGVVSMQKLGRTEDAVKMAGGNG